jgi:hypothetical protein
MKENQISDKFRCVYDVGKVIQLSLRISVNIPVR